MLITQGAERSERVDLRLACTLSAVAGALNAAALYVAGFFAANMTGNVSSLSDHLALGQWATAGFYLSIVVLFIFGATVCALAVNAGVRQGVKGIYALMVLIEAAILTILWAAWQVLDTQARVAVLVLGLSFALGLQNAVVTRISATRVRTTHVSGMATDIGIELGILIDRLRGKALNDVDAAYLSRLKLHGATIVSFLLGGVAGVGAHMAIGSAFLLACAGVLALFAISALLRLKTS